MKDVLTYLLFFLLSVLPFSMVKLDYHFLDSRIEEGRSFLVQQAFEEAFEVFEEVITSDPDDYRGHCGKAEALYRLGKLSESRDALDKAIALIDIQDKGHYEEADHHFRIANCRIAAHDYQNALTALKLTVHYDYGKHHYDSYLKQLQRLLEEDGDL